MPVDSILFCYTALMSKKTADSIGSKSFDVIIVGAGSAGCTAAIYATRFGLKTLMISGPMPGGLITTASDVENYPGFLSINGLELANKFLEQAKTLGAKYEMGVVESVELKDDGFAIGMNNKGHLAKTVILAMGTNHKKLGIPGEEKFLSRGVSYCATCDGPMFKGKNVVVIGGGNSAVEGAKDISTHAKNVFLVYRGELTAAPVYVDAIRKARNITEIADRNVQEVLGDNTVNSVRLDKLYNGSLNLETDGVFVQIGYIPSSDIARKIGVTLDKQGYVKVDPGMGANLKGVFAAGDLTNASNNLHQQVTSAAEGAIAAQSAYRYLNGINHII